MRTMMAETSFWGFQRAFANAEGLRRKHWRAHRRRVSRSLSPTDQGLFMSLGRYGPQAKQRAGGRVLLFDGDELVDRILAHYEYLNSRYKGVIPLKTKYVPQPPAEE
jgi:hypothetical protein